MTRDRHFEVPQDICYLCHLKLEKPSLDKAVMSGGDVMNISFSNRPAIDFNPGVSRCEICHAIPLRSLQSQLEIGDDSINKKLITHQTIQEAGVFCESCHFDVVDGGGEINTENVVSNGCLTCHNRNRPSDCYQSVTPGQLTLPPCNQ